jgi:hypothetical protein
MGVKRESALSRFSECSLEHVPRVGYRWLPIGSRNVAEHPRRRVDLVSPRKNLKRRWVRVGEHVGFVRSSESLDCRTVETETLRESAFDFRWSDCDTLEGADDVGEPQADELDSPLFDRAKHEVALLVHGAPL